MEPRMRKDEEGRHSKEKICKEKKRKSEKKLRDNNHKGSNTATPLGVKEAPFSTHSFKAHHFSLAWDLK